LMLLAGILLVLVHMLLRALRWGVLLSPVKRGVSFRNLFSLALVGVAIPTPAGVGGFQFFISIALVHLFSQYLSPNDPLRRPQASATAHFSHPWRLYLSAAWYS